MDRTVERSLSLHLETCTPVREAPAPESEWAPLWKAAQGTPYSQGYLSLLALTGRLEPIKQPRLGYTTRQAIATY